MSRLFDHLGNFGNRARAGSNMSPRLGIIVSYRDRADHLDEFLFEATRFFATDPVNGGSRRDFSSSNRRLGCRLIGAH
jgi:hypothetical protein